MPRVTATFRLRLNNGTPLIESPSVNLGAQTSEVRLIVQHPTTAVPLSWGATDRFRATITITVDGIPYIAVSEYKGGILTNSKTGLEIPESVVVYKLPVSVDQTGTWRLTQRATTRTVKVVFELLSGSVDTFVTGVDVEEAPTPNWQLHHSVAFDSASSLSQTNQNQTLGPWSHTCSGSDRGIAVGVGSSAGSPGLTTNVTYAGSNLTELADGVNSTNHLSTHVKAAPASGTNNVQVSYASPDDEMAAIAISATGVDQTTPNNTVPSTATGSATSAATNAMASGAGEMAVGFIYSQWNGSTEASGATERDEEANIGGFTTLTGFTKDGASPNVTINATRTAVGTGTAYMFGGFSFKASVAASAAVTGTATDNITEADIV